MNTMQSNKVARTNKTTTTIIAAVATLVMGVIIGGAAAENGSMPNLVDTSHAKNSHTSALAPGGSQTPSGGLNQWNPFSEIRRMQAQMDQMFSQMTEQFQSAPSLGGFVDAPGYSLSLDVRDLKDHYEIHAWLPDAKASDVRVNLQNNQTLRVQVDSQQQVKSSNVAGNSTNAVTRVAEWGQYEQEVQLPSPVKADQMKITHQGHELIITVPKATPDK